MEINLAPSIQISAHMSLSMNSRDLKLAVHLGPPPLSISQELADDTNKATNIAGAFGDASSEGWAGRAVSWAPGGVS